MKNTAPFLSVIGLVSILTILPSHLLAAPPREGAVLCDKCKMVTVKYPIQTGFRGQTIIYRDRSTMVCPDCHTAMENFFKTGKLKHTCTNCGGTMTICH